MERIREKLQAGSWPGVGRERKRCFRRDIGFCGFCGAMGATEDFPELRGAWSKAYGSDN